MTDHDPNDRDQPASTDSAHAARAFRRGDAKTVREVELRVRRILRFRGFRIPAEDRRDLRQEVMTQLWQAVHRSDFRPDLGFWGLVETVAGRRAIDWLRSRRPVEESLEATDGARAPALEAPSTERSFDALTALRGVGEPCRRLIYLKIAAGLTYDEISPLAGKTPGALRVQMHRCLDKARQLLADREPADGTRRRRGRA